MNGAARERRAQATRHDLGDIIKAEPCITPQCGDDLFLNRRRTLAQMMPDMAAIRLILPPPPTSDRSLRDPQLARQTRNRICALLNIGPDLWCGRGVGV